jgi:hypothetical protein
MMNFIHIQHLVVTGDAGVTRPRAARRFVCDTWPQAKRAYSGGRCNAFEVVGEELSEGFAGCVEAEALAGPVVELSGDGG